MSHEDDVELLGVSDDHATTLSETTTQHETVVVGHRRRWVTPVIVAAGVLGAIGLATTGSDRSRPPAPDAPTRTSTTAPPDDAPSDDAPPPVPDDQPATNLGPQLVWNLVDTDTAATDFRWFDGGFVGVGAGGVGVQLRPDDAGAAANLVLGPDTIAPPVEAPVAAIGEPPENPALIRFLGGADIAIDPVPPSPSDLVQTNVAVAVQPLGDRYLILQTGTTVLDVEAFRQRSGVSLAQIFGLTVDSDTITVTGPGVSETVDLDDRALTDVDGDALRTIGVGFHRLSLVVGDEVRSIELDMDRVDWIAVIGGEFVVGGTEIRRSADGETWEEGGDATPRFGGLLPPGPDGTLTGLAFDGDQGNATFSVDGARTWDQVERPFENTWQMASVSPVLAMTGWQGRPGAPPSPTSVVLTPSFELRLDQEAETFQLLDRDRTVLLSGSVGDPSSGFRFAPGSTDIWFVDPATGEEIARIPQRRFASSIASSETAAGDPQLVAFIDLADVAAGSGTDWFVAPVNEVFGPDALSVDFVPGDGWLLADVLTTTGRELYTARVPAG